MLNNKKCPICNTKRTLYFTYAFDYRLRFSKKKFIYNKCSNCEVVYLTNIEFNSSYYETYYGPNYYGEKDGFRNKFEQFYCSFVDKHKESLLLNNLKSKNKNKYKILEIGSGNGRFLKSLDNNKFDRHGVDIVDVPGKSDDGTNIKFFKEDILSRNFKKNEYDVIVMWHVIEHIPEPNKLMSKINSMLKKNGLLVLSTPNTGGVGFKIAGGKWFHFDAPRHVFLYSIKSLDILATQNKFSLIGKINPFFDFPLDIFYSTYKSIYAFLVLPLYPFIKLFSQETLIYIFEKK